MAQVQINGNGVSLFNAWAFKLVAGYSAKLTPEVHPNQTSNSKATSTNIINGELVFVALPRDLCHPFASDFVAESGRGRNGSGNDMDALHGRRVPVGQRDQPAYLSHHQAHRLWCDEEGHCALFSSRSLLLQLQTWRSCQPLPTWLQCHYQVMPYKSDEGDSILIDLKSIS
ncbi:hypothetical protein E2542_SST08937 [Spatholobus suberectus]|nr:hypothetical protein E2542_SST08937 [Spatholobus suberectus]